MSSMSTGRRALAWEQLAAGCSRLSLWWQWEDGPQIAMGNWNMEAAALEASGWLPTVQFNIVAPNATTCTGGKGSVKDFFVVFSRLGGLGVRGLPC